MRLLCFSDIHGNVDAVRAMVKDIQHKGIVYDAAIFAGDFTNLIFEHDIEKSQNCYDETVELVCSVCDCFFYIFGNRDKPQKYFKINKKGTLIDRVKEYRIGGDIWVTTTPELIDGNTIYVGHNPFMPNRYGNNASTESDSYLIYKKALLHIAGHSHKGIFTCNYLNTGFLYEDGAHGDKPAPGGYCDVHITDNNVMACFNSIGPVHELTLSMNGYIGKQFTVNEINDLKITFV